jgi:hypothetical protein
MSLYQNVVVGKYIYAARRDGRDFIGYISDVVKYKGQGRMVTVLYYTENREEYRNVYLDDCRDWRVYDTARDLCEAVNCTQSVTVFASPISAETYEAYQRFFKDSLLHWPIIVIQSEHTQEKEK